MLEAMAVREGHSEPSFPSSRVELLIVGPTGVGKSSLLKCLRGGEFSSDMDSTIGFDFAQRKFSTGAKNCSAKIWDTSGQAVFRDTVRTQYRAADVVMFVFDVSRPETLRQLGPYISDARQAVETQRGRELILVANKIDLRSGTEEEPLLGGRAVTPEDATAFCEEHGLSDYREVSALTGANVKLTFSQSLAHAAFRASRDVTPHDVSAQKQAGCVACAR